MNKLSFIVMHRMSKGIIQTKHFFFLNRQMILTFVHCHVFDGEDNSEEKGYYHGMAV